MFVFKAFFGGFCERSSCAGEGSEVAEGGM